MARIERKANRLKLNKVNYFLSGLSVESEFELPLEPIDQPSVTDVRIGMGSVHHRSHSVRHEFSDNFRWSSTDKEIILSWPGMTFSVTSDGVIVEASDYSETINHLLKPVWSVLLSARGREALHASVVAHDGKALAIAGASGSGKSTAALTLLDRGWTLLADDMLTVGDRLYAQPGPQFIRLTPDRADGRNGYWDRSGKLNFTPALSPCPVSLSAVVIHSAGCTGLEQVYGTLAVDLLLSNVYNLITVFHGQPARRLQLALALASGVPIYRVPPRSLTVDLLEHIAWSARSSQMASVTDVL